MGKIIPLLSNKILLTQCNRAGVLKFAAHNTGGGKLCASSIEGHLCVGMYFENGDYFDGFTTMYEDWSFERVVSTFEECFDA